MLKPVSKLEFLLPSQHSLHGVPTRIKESETQYLGIRRPSYFGTPIYPSTFNRNPTMSKATFQEFGGTEALTPMFTSSTFRLGTGIEVLASRSRFSLMGIPDGGHRMGSENWLEAQVQGFGFAK